MLVILSISIIIIGYLFGSIPVGYLVGRLYGVNLLKSGSGRTGGTNVLRAVGLPGATFTILGDALKGVIPTYIAVNLFPSRPWVAALVGFAAVLGHNHSIFLKFRGGAGGVTALAALAALSLYSALAACSVAIIVIVITRYASAATLSGSVAGLILLIILALTGLGPAGWPAGYIIYGVLVVALISWGLRPNFARIRAGTERKIGSSQNPVETT